MHSPMIAFVAAMLMPGAAAAHAIAERYDLPVPLGFYVAGAAATVALSFVVIGTFAYASPGRPAPSIAIGFWATHRAPRRVLQMFGVALLVLTIAAGLIGNPHPARNWAPTMVWIVFWVGFNFVAAFIANLWPCVNPWAAIDEAAARWRGTDAWRPYPAWLGVWPAVILLLIFTWIEVVFPAASDPWSLAWLIIAYSLLTWTGMAVFGRAAWLQHGEVFAVLFAVLGRFAPLAVGADGHARLRSFASGLSDHRPEPPGMVAFVLLMLASVLFDGFLGTSLWRASEAALGALLPQGADRFGTARATLGLLVIWGVFLGAYLATCAITARLVAGTSQARQAALFVPSLVPIAVGYNVAHNLSYLLVQGQTIAALASDPFGFGWNLFGTARLQPDISVIDVETIWYVAIVAIVGGHLIAVWLAHRAAQHVDERRGRAIVALIPMTVLMVLYTGVSLSILAEPMVRYSTPDPGYTLVPLTTMASDA